MNRPKILIFIVAYNAEKTLKSVISRIPENLREFDTEILVIDDCSKDQTFQEGLRVESGDSKFRIMVLRNPENLGYGGNQKLGYRYAIDKQFDFVALVHGDGQYAPEKLPELLQPLIHGEADVVFGSRMINKKDAIKGGMPLYKWIGNQILTTFQNFVLGSNLSEFHTGYRLYSIESLKKIPFERNANDFHFDTDIIVQIHMAGLSIIEKPIPTFYGDEVCHVNGFKYAWDICISTIRGKLHLLNLFYDRKYDLGQPQFNYDLKLGFPSSHTVALDAVKTESRILDIGCGQGLVACKIAEKAASVVGLDQYAMNTKNPKVQILSCDLDSYQIPVDVSQFDQIFMLDIIEHLKDPETFMENLRVSAKTNRPEIVITTANVGFFSVRLMLLLGKFNYGRKGILDRTHTRLFTFESLTELLQQTGYSVLEVKGIPAPFPKAIGDNFLSKVFLSLNQWLIKIRKGLFSYQIFVRVKSHPTVQHLLSETLEASCSLKEIVKKSNH
jgi:glycosyltransferase involved in cell wall biosynthesis